MSKALSVVARAALLLWLLVGATATPASASVASEALVRDFVAWVDASPDWSATVGVVRSSGRDTYAEGLVISRSDPAVSASIETMRMRDLADWNDGFSATGIWFNGAAIVAESFEYDIPSAKVEAITVPGMTGIVFDPRHMMSFFAKAYSALSEATFSNFTIPEMTASSKQVFSESGETAAVWVTYTDVAISALRAGIIERVEAGPIGMELSTADGDFALTVDQVSTERTDLGALAHVFDPAAYGDGAGDGVWRPLIASIDYSNVVGSGPKGLSFRLDSLRMEGLDARQLEEPFTALWDQLLDLTVAGEEKADLALDLVETYEAWRLGTLSLSSLDLKMPADSVALSLQDLAMSGLSADGVVKLALSALRSDTPEFFVSLGSMELDGFRAPDLEALLGFAALESGIDEKMHAETIAKTVAGFPRLSHLGMTDLVGGKNKDETFSLETLTLDFRDWNDVFAEATDLTVTGLTFPQQLRGPETAALIRSLGYDDIVLGISFSDRWTPASGTDQATWTFALRDGGDLQLSYTLTGVTLDWMVKATATAGASENSEKALKAMIDDLKLRRASISITDRSLLERAFGYAAEVQSLDVDGRTYREQMRAALPFLISAAMPPAITKLLAKPMQQFLAGSQTLIAEINPPSPLNMTELLAEAENPLAIPHRLNMTVRTETPTR